MSKSTKSTPQSTFWLGIWISFILFGQNLAWIYYLTLEISMRKNFQYFSKSKMADGGQTFNSDQIFGSKMTYWLCKRILFIQFWQYLAGTFYLTIVITLWKFFIFFKIQDGGQGRHYGELRNQPLGNRRGVGWVQTLFFTFDMLKLY